MTDNRSEISDSGAKKQRHTRKKGPGRMPHTKAPGRPGIKAQRAANKGLLGMDQPGGVVSEALREMVRDKRKTRPANPKFVSRLHEMCIEDCDQ